jgi:LysR family glycine cleavage system transcriptional activator
MGALRAFVVSARHLSFTRAAEEMNVTQAAISRRVAALEAFLGIALFERIRQKLKLTPAGSSYLLEVQILLNDLERCTRDLVTGGRSSDSLNIAILPTLGSRWLIPRLPHFLKANPNVQINFMTRSAPFNFAGEKVDAAVHFGEPNWPNVLCEFLFKEHPQPVCSPKLLQGGVILSAPSHLANVTLLHTASEAAEWEDWLKGAGADDVDGRRGLIFEHRVQLIEAALAGIGVALVPGFLIETELETKELIPLFPFIENPLASDERKKESYYFVYPKEKAKLKAVKLFRDWILAEAATVSAKPRLEQPARPSAKR